VVLAKLRESRAELQFMIKPVLPKESRLRHSTPVLGVGIRSDPSLSDIVHAVRGSQSIGKLGRLECAIGVAVPILEPSLWILEKVWR
jgi:hypothetical protein